MTLPGYIGFSGPCGAGKTTAADMMAEMLKPLVPVYRRNFSDKLKEVAEFMGWDGEKDERGRRLLQLLGTEVGRGYDPEIWVKHWHAAIEGGQHPLAWGHQLSRSLSLLDCPTLRHHLHSDRGLTKRPAVGYDEASGGGLSAAAVMIRDPHD